MLDLIIEAPVACFTEAGSDMERNSYPFPTHSALIGCIGSVYWKPEMRWIIEEATILSPIAFRLIKTNETTKASKGPFCILNYRTQRTNRVLSNVRYRVKVRAACDRSQTHSVLDKGLIKKHESILQRRLEKGQLLKQPFLGSSHMFADLSLADPATHYEPYNYSDDIPNMLYDFTYTEDGRVPVYRRVHCDEGVISYGPHALSSKDFLFLPR